ncbi:MAG: rhodanese-like domain-containing protein [Alicyclobacillaceae bacterium]|nr:rhodanese-like domain-containing protein [Alicyclobacillaceae bacterium]
MRECSPDELWHRIRTGDRPRIIDVRQPEEYAAGHIPGAELIPVGDIPAVLDRIPKDEEIVFVCRSGNRSGYVCAYLAHLGYDRVVNMKGGMLQWQGDLEYGLPSPFSL